MRISDPEKFYRFASVVFSALMGVIAGAVILLLYPTCAWTAMLAGVAWTAYAAWVMFEPKTRL